MSPCSVLIFSLVLISFNKIDSATIRTRESSTLEHYPVDSLDIDVKVVSKRSDEITATETNTSVEKPNTVIVVGTVDDDASKELEKKASTNEAEKSDEKSNPIIKDSSETPSTDSDKIDEHHDVNGKSEAESRIVRNVPITSTGNDDFGPTSGPEYLPPISRTSGPEYLPPTSTPGPQYLPPAPPIVPGDDENVNPKTAMGIFG